MAAKSNGLGIGDSSPESPPGEQWNAIPFVKWAGGKRWLAPALVPLFGECEGGRYIEPFAGGAAVFFRLDVASALLADANGELIAAYRAVRDNPEQLIRRLDKLRVGPRVFLRVRDQRVRSDLGRATRLIYLNRTAFNGLYRVNRFGKFNVPYGCKETTRSCDPDAIRSCSDRLRKVVLRHADFRQTMRSAKSGDSVYVDPPYTVKHNNNAFRRYNENIFAWKDQKDIARSANALAREGARIVVSNALHPDIESLYSREAFIALVVGRPTNLAASPLHRGRSQELLLVSRSFALSAREIAELVAERLSSTTRLRWRVR